MNDITMQLKVFSFFQLNEKNPNDPGKCNSSNHGRMKLVRDRNGDERTIICNKDESNSYLWKSIDGWFRCMCSLYQKNLCFRIHNI